MRNKAVLLASVLIMIGLCLWSWTSERIWLVSSSLAATVMFFSLAYCFYLEKRNNFNYFALSVRLRSSHANN